VRTRNARPYVAKILCVVVVVHRGVGVGVVKDKGNSQFDFKDRVRAAIEGLKHEQTVRFAWVCAVMALPFLGDGKGFAYWKDVDRQGHLNAVFKGLDVSVFFALGGNVYADRAILLKADRVTYYTTADLAVDACNAVADTVAIAYANVTHVVHIAAASRIATSIVRAAPMRNVTLRIGDRKLDVKALIFEIIDAISADKPLPHIDVSVVYGKTYRNFISDLKSCDCEYWVDWYDSLYKNGFIFDKDEVCLRLDAPSLVQEEGAAAVGKHMLALKNQGKRETKEARIILLGSKGAGKTSLARKLRNTWLPLPRKEESTAGVDTLKLDLIKNETTHLWDFGGHVIIQSAHKCFMSAECVYVLVLEGRTKEQQEIEEYRKWLTTIKSYSGGNAKVFILLNESDIHTYEMPEEQLMEEFPNLIAGFEYINLKWDKPKLRTFRETLKNHIETNLSRKLPAKYFSVKQEFENQFKKHKKEILNEADINEVVSKVELSEGNQGVLDYLNTLGVALSYDEFPGVVLNPSWISHGVYTIINHLQNSKKIKIHREELPALFTGKDKRRYGYDNCKLLYNLMVKYELAFEVNDEPNMLLVPAVLGILKPSEMLKPNQDEETLARRYTFDIALPDSIFPRYIQRNHIHIKQREDKRYIVGRGGLSLEKNNTRANITKESRKVEITTWGKNKDDFLEELHNMFLDLLKEHHLQWDRDEVKCSQGYKDTGILSTLYYENKLAEFEGDDLETIVNNYKLLENLYNKIGLVNVDISLGGSKNILKLE